MEQVKQLNEQEQMLKALPYPSFLAYKFKVEDFCYKKQVSVNNEQTLIQYLIKKHNKPNTIVLFNGRVVLNNLEKVKVNNNAIPNVINTKFDFLNKEHLNSSLKIEFLESIEDEIKIIIGGSADLYHYSEYYLEDNCKIKITEQFDLTSRVKLNYNNKIQLKQSANLQMLLVETLKNKKSNVVNFNIDLNKKAELNFNLINLNNANVVNTLSSNLKGEQASVKINTINFANEYFKLANLIRLEHLAKETNSQINNFGVVNNEGELIIDGVNIIEQGFSKSQASQKTKNH